MYLCQLRSLLGALVLLLLLASCSSQRVTSSSSRKAPKRSAHRVEKKAPEEKSAQADPVVQVVEVARTFIGTPYRYGGIDKKGIDCSGLLVSSFRAIDVNLPRTSEEQSGYGKAVSIYELQPGDLVFFSARKWKGKVSHAGMVTEVRSKEEVFFIHSSTSKGVVESNLLSPYYRNIFVKARRPF